MEFFTPSGVGSTPVGSTLGGSGTTSWGLFSSTLNAVANVTSCESCGRERSEVRLGGIALFASYTENGQIFVVGSDVTPPVTCFSVRWDGPSGSSFVTSLSLVPALPPAISTMVVPSQTAPTPPAGAQLATSLLVAALPEVDVTGLYTATLVDRCGGIETPLDTFSLEAPPMIHSPFDADLGGAPRAWIDRAAGRVPGAQPGSGSRASIPFDKCAAVIEYDARRGTLPAAQGFTHAGSGSAGNFQLIEGGVLHGVTTSTLPSYFAKQLTLSADPGEVHSYAEALVIAGTHTSPSDGLVFDGRYTATPSGAFQGVRYALVVPNQWRTTKLDSSSDNAVAGRADGWTRFATSHIAGSPAHDQQWIEEQSAYVAQLYGTTGTNAAIVCQMIFGDINGSGIDALVRNAIVSLGGRFIRAGWSSFTQVSNPVIRLYLTADANGSASKTARFRISYGTGTGNPYAALTVTAEATVAFTTANIVYEVPFQLSALTPNSPFWFTVERVWDHGDDKLTATAHLLQATVRSV